MRISNLIQTFHTFELVESSNFLSTKDQINKLSKSESRIFISGHWIGKDQFLENTTKIKRKNGPFVVINGALLDAKYELELFGEEKKMVQFLWSTRKASGGILLIDEVTEIPLETQSKDIEELL